MKKMTECRSCGSVYETKLVRCPYCGTAYDPAAEDDPDLGRLHAAENDDDHADRHAVHVLQPPVRPDALLDGQQYIQHPSNEIRANRREAG